MTNNNIKVVDHLRNIGQSSPILTHNTVKRKQNAILSIWFSILFLLSLFFSLPLHSSLASAHPKKLRLQTKQNMNYIELFARNLQQKECQK